MSVVEHRAPLKRIEIGSAPADRRRQSEVTEAMSGVGPTERDRIWKLLVQSAQDGIGRDAQAGAAPIVDASSSDQVTAPVMLEIECIGSIAVALVKSAFVESSPSMPTSIKLSEWEGSDDDDVAKVEGHLPSVGFSDESVF
jgi:hypothetical protein